MEKLDPVEEMRKQVCKELQGSVTIVVLGASGDLAKKKTFPALFGLFKNGFLPDKTQIIGYARTPMSPTEFITRVSSHIKPHPDLASFQSRLTYVSGQYDQDESFKVLNEAIGKLEEGIEVGKRHRVFYMALPPSVFIPVAQGLKKNVYGLEGLNRIVVEKPFGRDSESSAELSKALSSCFTEEETFRIDHYLGKEMVKNVMMVRFANIFFSHIWNRMHIDNIQITFKEPFGTEGREGYFDQYGIIRDVMQNHLLQVLSLIAMERPISTEAEAIRDEKVKVLKCIPPIDLKDALLGQYGQHTSPTYAALVLWIQNERWEGVPFILKAGKGLNEAKVEVRVQFRNVAGNLYRNASRNELVMRVQPDEAVYIKFNNKQPGLSYQTIQTDLDLTYHSRYTEMSIPDAYESLLLDVLRNDHSNFVRNDELVEAWKIFTPLLHQVDRGEAQFSKYEVGSRGPEELQAFVKRYGYDRAHVNYSWPIQSVATKK